ncbi:unnamed protein product [Symbiodinium sp. CCMP2456]|nr:unnamed protein product [Symbiodinium sp. CCMP2456]
MALTVSVSTVNGKTFEVQCEKEDTVGIVRAELEQKHIEVPAGCFLKLFHGPQALHDGVTVAKLDLSQPVFAVIGRETKVEVLLEAAGSWLGYKELVQAAAASCEGQKVKVIKKIPSILDVLEDMGGQKPEVADLRQGEKGLQFKAENGHLLLPSLNLEDLRGFSKVMFSVKLNSDVHNQGLGVVVVQPSSMQCDKDQEGIPKFLYNGYGLKADKNSNAIKFHPGMGGGQLRVEGVGGFGNQNIGFTPENWTDSGNSFHTLEVSLGTDGLNHLKFTGHQGAVWERTWENRLTDGRYTPELHAWLDMGGSFNPGSYVIYGDIDVEVHVNVPETEGVA